jgi:hypothetical protein
MRFVRMGLSYAEGNQVDLGHDPRSPKWAKFPGRGPFPRVIGSSDSSNAWPP